MAKVLVIDDDVQLLRMVSMMLERGGHDPAIEEDPRKGLDRVKEEEPDLLILDVMMPDISGHELCEIIRNDEETAHVPILMLTARAQAVDREAALASGADDYLSKPVKPETLMSHIDALLHPATAAPDDERPGSYVVSFFGMRGGVGRTTLAANLGTALRMASSQEVCVIDLSPSGGQLTAHLRLATGATWNDLPTIKELDWPALKQTLLLHRCGMRVLAAPAQPQLAIAPSGELAAAVLSLLRWRGRFVIVDLPPVLNPAVQAVLERSDMVFQVVTGDIVSVQMARHTARSLERMELSGHKAYLLNQVTPTAQLSTEAVEKGLRSRLAFNVGYDENQLRALAQGVPLTLTKARSPLPSTVRQMASAIWQRVQAHDETPVDGTQAEEEPLNA
ncbi:MAG TPA: response regulator [Candidatus Sulfomarinibacteraceae bacterium]|nr:response regulator [Candidatus Sulfomarinibacteraceae bacterium]